MLGSLAVTLREGFEAALVIGIVLAYLRQAGASERARHVWLGVVAAAAASAVMGGILFASGSELHGTSEALYEGTAMLLAAGVVTWMIFWMGRQARTLGASLRSRVSEALVVGGHALFWVAFVATAREGIETALFMYASTGNRSPVSTLVGGSIGLVLASVLGVAVYRGGRRLDLGLFFRVTSIALLAFSAYLVFGGLHEFGEAAGNEALEMAAPVVAVLYVVGMLSLYLRPPAWLARQPS
jgi:high-affinity iron transporter